SSESVSVARRASSRRLIIAKRSPKKRSPVSDQSHATSVGGSQLYGGTCRAKRAHAGRPGAEIGDRASCRDGLVRALKGDVELDLPSPARGRRLGGHEKAFLNCRESI